MKNIILKLLSFFIIVIIFTGCGVSTIQQQARYGNITEVQKLVRSGVNVNLKDRNGETALVWAAVNGNTNIMKYLLAIAVAFIILVIASTVNMIFAAFIDNVLENLEDPSKFQYVLIGLTKIIPLIIGALFIKISWKRITREKGSVNENG